MDKQGNLEKKDLMRCNKISLIIPSIYYSLQQLKRLDKEFEQSDTIKETEVLLLDLFSLLDIKEDKSVYIQQYREVLGNALMLLGDFMLQLKQSAGLEKQPARFFRIMDDLSRDHKAISNIIR